MTDVHEVKTRARQRAAAPTFLQNALFTIALMIVGSLGLASRVSAQQPAPESPTAATASGATAAQIADDQDEDEDGTLDPAEPDFVLVNLPTTARLPLWRGNFRLTHRFAGNLANSSFKEMASNLFGIDQGAIIGFEYRVGIMPGVQAAAYRTNFDRTIQLYGKYDAIRQKASMPIAASALVSIEGTNNFQEKFAPALGVVLSRTVAGRVALYATPIWVNNTAASLDEHTHEGTSENHTHVQRSTTYLGLGARIRVLSRTYLVGEMSPRLGGYAPDQTAFGFGIEKRVGYHMFSLTFTNTFATTFAQLARGGSANTLYLGFNLGRKFF